MKVDEERVDPRFSSGEERRLLDERTRELVAIGASVAAGCLRCLLYHAERAEKFGISRLEIREAVELARWVKGRPAADLDHVLETLLGDGQT